MSEAKSDPKKGAELRRRSTDPVTTEPDTTAKSTRVEKAKLWLAHQLLRNPTLRWMVWAIVMLVWMSAPAVAYIDYVVLIKPLWNWSFERWWHWIPSVFGLLICFSIPVWIAMLAAELSTFAADITFTDESYDVAKANERVVKTEDDVIQLMENDDEAKLLPLLRYSRVQLEAYYASGLKQSKRSYNNAMIAMWLGFILLVSGIVLFVAPLQQFAISKPNAEFSYVIMGSAGIIEFIAAMFLWVYRSTNGQLTYYYRLQMRSHTAVLSFRMASTMTGLQDETKRYIIENMVDPSILPERPDVLSSKGIAALLK